VDFCEPDYLHSIYIAEPYNAASSLYFCFIGFAGIFYANPTSELMFVWPYAILITIGFGSAGLHTSLHWFYQSLDEVPMLWLNMSTLYILTVMQYEQKNGSEFVRKISAQFLISSFLMTIFYYVNRSFYAIFIAVFSTSTIILIFWSGHLALVQHKGDPLMRKLYFAGITSFVLVGTLPWIIDMNLCSMLMPYYMYLLKPFQGLTLHVIWHVAAGYGGHYLILVLVYARARSVKKKVRLHYFWHLVPVLSEVKDVQKSGSRTKKQN